MRREMVWPLWKFAHHATRIALPHAADFVRGVGRELQILVGKLAEAHAAKKATEVASPAPAPTGASPSAANLAVAETPREGRGREQGRGGRYRSESRTRRESAERRGSRGRSIERRERSYDPRSNSLDTNRERSRSAFRDKNTGNLLPNRLYTLSKLLVKVCRHTATEDFGIAPSDLGWLPLIKGNNS